jgi:transposase
MCGGMGRISVDVVIESEPPPAAPGCPQCGEVYQVLIIRKDADAA